MSPDSIKNYFTKQFTFKDSFIFIFSLLTIYILPFIINNLPYRDDEVRILRGNNWSGLGRKMSDILMNSLSFSFDTIANIAPLTWLISLVILSLTLVYFIQKSFINKNLFNHIAISFIVINPFYLQNLSYQYDCLTMSSGLCLAVLAFTIDYKKRLNVFYSFLLLLGATFFFQPVSNIFILLTALNIIITIKDKNSITKDTLISFAIYSISIITYYFLFKHFFDYAAENRSGIAHEGELGITIMNAFWIFSQFFKSFIFSVGGIFIAVSLLFMLMAYLVCLYKNGFNKLLILKIISPLIIVFSLWGPFILLDESFARPRVFITFGFIMMAGFLLIEQYLKNIKNFNFIIITLVSLYFFSLCYQYNQLASQEYSYNKMLTEWISKDINDSQNLYSKKIIYLNSHPDYSEGSKIILNNNPFLKFVQMPYYNWFSRYYLQNRGVENVYKDLTNIDDSYDWKAICEKQDAKLIKENRYYNIYIINNPKLANGNQNHVSIWFKRKENLCLDKPNIVFKRNLFFYE